jgi:hypothetical protein
VQQIQGSTVQMPANWPAGGVAPQWQALLTALVQQASAGQPLPQQLLAAQSWPSALAQAVLQGAGASSAPAAAPLGAAPPATPGTVPGSVLPQGAPATLAVASALPPTAAAQLAASAPGAALTSPAGDTVRPALPPLQNWVVQQGVLQGPDGDRAFTLTLKVPVAWAQAQSALGQALAGAAGSNTGTLAGLGSTLTLPYGSSVQQLANATFGLVMVPQGLSTAQAQAMRTSAVLHMDFQPLPATIGSAAQQAAATALLPPGVLPQDAYQALLARGGDPWLHMAQQQASGQFPRERPQHREGHCDVRECQYQGRAECAQPFCAEMNSLWATDRASRANRR